MVFEEARKIFIFMNNYNPYQYWVNALDMRNLFIAVCLLLSTGMFGQTKTSQPKPTPYDTIVRFGNRKIPVTKLTMGSLTVTYALPEKPDSIIRLERKEIEKIIYKNGNISVLNKSVVEVVKDDQWQAVLITKDPKEVEGLYKRGEVNARASMSSRDKKRAQESATVKLQKKAAGQKAYIVLITREEYYGGYGDPPGYYVEGVSYGKEPLEKGTDVADPKNKDTKSK